MLDYFNRILYALEDSKSKLYVFYKVAFRLINLQHNCEIMNTKCIKRNQSLADSNRTSI